MIQNRISIFLSRKHIIQILLVNRHKLGDKGFQMKNILAPHGDPMFIKGRSLDHLMLQLIIQTLEQFPRQSFQNDTRRNAIDEQFVQPLPGRNQSRRTLLLGNLLGEVLDVHLPIRLLHRLILLQHRGTRVHAGGFEHEHRPPEIPIGLPGDRDGESVGEGDALLPSDGLEDVADVVVGGCGDADAEASGSDGFDDFGLVVGAEDEAARGGVFFHGSSECCLRLAG
jgi:hypothetical protein